MKISTLIFLLLFSSGLYANDAETLANAEIVAQNYLAAFYHGDLKTAVDLTHPEMLTKLKRDFLARAESGALEDTEFSEYLESVEFAELLNMRPADLFVTIQEISRSRAPANSIEAMKKATVTIGSSEQASKDVVLVTLKVLVPTPSGGMEKDSPVYLKIFHDEYRVTMP